MRKRLTIIFTISVLLLAGVGIYFGVPSIFGSVVVPLPNEYQGFIQTSGRKYNVDSCLIAAIINGESRWDPSAHSGVGAQGLMQLEPGTAQSIAREIGVAYGPLSNPQKNIELGTALTRYNLDHYGSLRNILVAYNAGGGRVGLPDSLLPRETQFYITKISRYYNLYASVYPDFCTGPSLIGRPISSTAAQSNPSQSSLTPTPSLPPFVPPPATNNSLNIENFWKSFLNP